MNVMVVTWTQNDMFDSMLNQERLCGTVVTAETTPMTDVVEYYAKSNNMTRSELIRSCVEFGSPAFLFRECLFIPNILGDGNYTLVAPREVYAREGQLHGLLEGAFDKTINRKEILI